MFRATKTAFVICGMLLLGASIKAQRSAFQISDFIGTYSYSAEYSGSSVTIEPEGRFHIVIGDCTQEYHQSGTYEIRNGVLILTTTKSTVKHHGESDEQAKNLLDPTVFREMYRQDPPAERKTEELMPIRWGERLYLIHRDGVSEFCNAINLGLEPRNDLRSNGYFGTFYLRNGDQNKKVTGHPALSTELLGQLLEKPVESTIKSILIDGDVNIAIIDQGSEVGLKPGMRFVVDNARAFDAPNLWFKGLVVMSVDSHFAKLKVLPFEEVEVGDKVSTKFVDRRFQSN